VTGNSSGRAFYILHTNAAGKNTPGGPGLFPHVHQKTYENFYAVKGRVQLWGQNLDRFLSDTSVQQTRILGPGDFGGIPNNTIHTFNLLEPDTQLTGVLVPGGFEELLFNMNASPIPAETLPGAGGFDPSELGKWDVYPRFDFTPRQDAVNGKAGPGNWYDGQNILPAPTGNSPLDPIWVAKNYGPKYLNSENGRYQIVTPFVTGEQTNDKFSQGTITISLNDPGVKAPLVKSTVATALYMEEGQLEVTVEGFDPVTLIDGDLVFVPGSTSFSYFASAYFTKFMYVTGGGRDMDFELVAKGRKWDSAFYPPPAANHPETSSASGFVWVC
ncbi:RmlC-like cupin domain-containing protein, partial [Podospora didyma]